jgi:tetratricopeptide (TPR) repeat protein
MKSCLRIEIMFVVVATLAVGVARAESPGRADLDNAMRAKVNAEGLPQLNEVIDLLQSAVDKGLDAEDADFAEIMMSDALMQRATALVRVINTRSILDNRVQQIYRLVVSDLRRVLAYDDPPTEANFLLGKLMALPGGDPHESRRALTEFLQTEDLPPEQRAEALALRARVQTDEAKALDDLDEAIQLSPENGAYRLVRAVFLRSRGKLDESLAEVDKVLEQTPEDANALILQGEVFRELGQNDKALESFDQATQVSPQAPAPYQERGEIYREQEEYDKALEQFNKVLELQPGELLTLVHRAEVYLRTERFDEALSDVDAVLAKQPVVLAHRIRAEVLANMNRLQEAIDELQRVTAAAPNEVELRMLLALYYQVDNNPRQAIEIYSEVLTREADNALALRSRGDAYLALGEHAAAVADFEEALQHLDDDPSLLNNLAWVLATSPDAEVRNGKRAVELATKACELTEYNKPYILSTLAAAFAENGDFQTAIEWSQKAVDMDDSDQEEQLAKELASYQGGHPWRERQSLSDKEGAAKKKAAPSPTDAPNQSLDF